MNSVITTVSNEGRSTLLLVLGSRRQSACLSKGFEARSSYTTSILNAHTLKSCTNTATTAMTGASDFDFVFDLRRDRPISEDGGRTRRKRSRESFMSTIDDLTQGKYSIYYESGSSSDYLESHYKR